MANVQMIFINLPVVDVQKSKAFYEAVGFTNNKMFSDDKCACMVLSDTINVMIMNHDRWKDFTSKTIPDAKKSAQVLLAISRTSKEECESIVAKAIQAGGKADPTPKQDLGFMYGRSFEDLDGHIWETAYMDMSQIPQQ